MSRYFVLYEPSKDGVQFKMDESVSTQLQGEIIYQDMALLNHRTFTEILSNEDKIVVCGDDRNTTVVHLHLFCQRKTYYDVTLIAVRRERNPRFLGGFSLFMNQL